MAEDEALVYEFKDDNAFQESFKQIRDFRREMIFSDIVICSDDERDFHCHKVILASGSPYFRAMFLADMKESQQTKIKIKGLDSQALEQLLEFCYTSKAIINSENVQQLVVAAGMLQFPKIQESCMEFLINNIDAANCIGIWKLAEAVQSNGTVIVENLESYIKTNFSFVAKHDEFQDLTVEQLSKFLESEELNIVTEDDISSAIIRWVRFDPGKRAVHLGNLIKNVRFFSLTRRHLMDVILNEELIVNDPFCRRTVFDAIRYHLLPESRHAQRSYAKNKAREKTTRYIYMLGGEGKAGYSKNFQSTWL